MSQLQQGNHPLKTFEQKVLNRSIGGLLLLEPLTDKLLEVCPVNISPNILSVLSCLPVFILSLWAYPSRICFLLATICFLLQQLFDTANKKQAIRLEQFSPLPLYVDRLCDVVSVVSSVVVVGKLLGVSHEWLWFSAWAFGVLPFYTHHLVMYYSEYMIFKPFSPETQGLLVVQLLFLVAVFLPTLFQTQVFAITLGTVMVILFMIWLLVFMVMDLMIIYRDSAKFNEPLAFKNMFVMFVLGYIMFENAVIEPQLLQSSLLFHFMLLALMFSSMLIILDVLHAAATHSTFHQISLNTLFYTAWLVVVYAICAFTALDLDTEVMVGSILVGLLVLVELGVVVRKVRLVIKEVSDVLDG